MKHLERVIKTFPKLTHMIKIRVPHRAKLVVLKNMINLGAETSMKQNNAHRNILCFDLCVIQKRASLLSKLQNLINRQLLFHPSK